MDRGKPRKDQMGHAKDGGLEAIFAETLNLEVTRLENLENVYGATQLWEPQAQGQNPCKAAVLSPP